MVSTLCALAAASAAELARDMPGEVVARLLGSTTASQHSVSFAVQFHCQGEAES